MGNGATKEKTEFRKLGETKIYSAPQLLSLNLKTPDWLIDGILPPGLTLFAALPKVGKSFFALEMLLCLTSRKIFPGCSMAPKKTKAIYLSLEDPLYIVRDRLKAMCDAFGIKHPPENLLIPDHRAFTDEKIAVRFLEDLLARHHPDFIVIDTLAAFIGGKVPKNNDYFGWISKGHGLRGMFEEAACSTLIIHHSNKNELRDGIDPIQAIMGSGGLPASVDNILFLAKKKQKTRNLHIEGKQALKTVIGLKFDNGMFQVVDNPELAQLAGRARQVYNVLFKEIVGKSPVEIACIMGLPKTARSSVHDALKKLEEKGLVVKHARGFYKLAEAYQQQERPLPLLRDGITAP